MVSLNSSSPYMKCFSTETALVKVINDLHGASDQVSILAMLDLSAAFDTLDHDILIDILSTTFGSSGCVRRWFMSYLVGCTQSVIVDGSISARSTLEYGVPQGSVLGPLLFTLYTYPLGNLISHYNISYHFYADDLQLYGSAVPCEVPSMAANLSIAITGVCSWMAYNKLKRNEDKTEIILNGTQNRIAKVTGLDLLMVLNSHIPFVENV